MSRVFDLDALVQEPQVIVWKGQEYRVKEPTVKDSIEFQRILGEMDASDASTVFQAIGRAVSFMVPGLPVEEIPSRRLMELLAFIRDGFSSGDAPKNAQAEGKGSRKSH